MPPRLHRGRPRRNPGSGRASVAAHISPVPPRARSLYLPTVEAARQRVRRDEICQRRQSVGDRAGRVGILSDGSTFVVTKGGGAGAQGDDQTQYNPGQSADVLKSQFVDRATVEGVDLTNGSVAYESPASISVGSGDFPYKLSAGLNYRAGPVPEPSFGPPDHAEPANRVDHQLAQQVVRCPAAAWRRWAEQTSVRSRVRLAAFLAEQDIFTTADATPQPTEAETWPASSRARGGRIN